MAEPARERVWFLTSSWRDGHQYEVSGQNGLILAVLQLLFNQSQNLSDPAGQATSDGDVGMIGSVNPAEDWTHAKTHKQGEERQPATLYLEFSGAI